MGDKNESERGREIESEIEMRCNVLSLRGGGDTRTLPLVSLYVILTQPTTSHLPHSAAAYGQV
jgi:hypothetical protein